MLRNKYIYTLIQMQITLQLNIREKIRAEMFTTKNISLFIFIFIYPKDASILKFQLWTFILDSTILQIRLSCKVSLCCEARSRDSTDRQFGRMWRAIVTVHERVVSDDEERDARYFVLTVKEYFHPHADGCYYTIATEIRMERGIKRDRNRRRETEAGEWKMNENEKKENSNKPARDDEWLA